MRDNRADQPPLESFAEVPLPPAGPPPAGPLEAIEAKLMRSIWLVISSLDDQSMVSVDIRGGFHRVHGPFGDHINEIFDSFDEYRGQLELMRTNLIEAAREVEAGTRPLIHVMEPRYRGPRNRIHRTMCEEIDRSFDSLRNRIGYESERRVVNGNVSDDDASLFSNPLPESDNENEVE